MQIYIQPASLFDGSKYVSSYFNVCWPALFEGRSGDPLAVFVSYMSTAGITIGVLSLITVFVGRMDSKRN